MPDSLVLDTNVIVYAVDDIDDENLGMHCWYIVSQVLMGDQFRVAIDTNGEILEEYGSKLKSINNHQARMVREFIKREIYQKPNEKNIVSHIPIREREIENLLAMGFHEDDGIFVRISPKTDLMTISSCDSRSFLNSDYRDWIQNNLSVGLLNPYQCKFLIDRL